MAKLFVANCCRFKTPLFRVVKIKRNEKNRLVLEETMAPDEETEQVRVWNPTVANLTLMVSEIFFDFLIIKEFGQFFFFFEL